jgi:hypothetical protein
MCRVLRDGFAVFVLERIGVLNVSTDSMSEVSLFKRCYHWLGHAFSARYVGAKRPGVNIRVIPNPNESLGFSVSGTPSGGALLDLDPDIGRETGRQPNPNDDVGIAVLCDLELNGSRDDKPSTAL